MPAHLLLVEDSPVNRSVAEALLHPLGHDIEAAGNGAAALEAVQAARYDLIFMDVAMPQLDGLAATRAIRALGGWCAAVPIVAMTASVEPGTREACRRAGMSDFIAKPLLRGELAACLERCLGPGAGGPLAEPVEDRAGGGAEPLLDREVLNQLRRDCRPVMFDEIVGGFLQESERRAAAMQGLEEAGELSRQAHTLKSLAGSLGAAALRRHAAEIEELCRRGDLAAARPAVAGLTALVRETGAALRALSP